MIIKSKSRTRGTWRQLLSYMERGADEESITLAHNLRGTTIDEWVEEFKEQEALRLDHRKGSVVLYHEILSFHDLDSNEVTPEKLQDIIIEYVNLRAERGLVVAMTHHDRNHVHAHLCISGTELATGRSMRMSKSQFTAVKRTIQAYQQQHYPELRHSIADHGRKARAVRQDKEHHLQQRTGMPSKREALSDELQELFGSAKSLEDFERLLTERGMELYRRNGRPQGVRADGVKYRLTNMGIRKDDIARIGRAPQRLREMRALRERRDRESELPSRERVLPRPAKASGGPTSS